ncbi:MAG: hypothetical protein OXF50_16915 [Caldilineaceae bacterium]|nr:hypothetical protein [Caldilineaceae bacterium]
MTDEVSVETAKKTALDTLVELTKPTRKSSRGSESNIPSEVRLSAAIELLRYANSESLKKSSSTPYRSQDVDSEE